jgi:hypothetical protein
MRRISGHLNKRAGCSGELRGNPYSNRKLVERVSVTAQPESQQRLASWQHGCQASLGSRDRSAGSGRGNLSANRELVKRVSRKVQPGIQQALR